jgi:hypothetical protein
MRKFYLSAVTHTYIRKTNIPNSYILRKENDIMSTPITAISKDGFFVRSRAVLKDVTKYLTPEQQKRKENIVVRWNNKIMGIKTYKPSKKKNNTNYKIKKNQYIEEIILDNGVKITVIKQGI